MRVGVMWRLISDEIEADIKMLCSMGFDCCHISIPDPALYESLDPFKLKYLFDSFGMQITAVWCGMGQPCKWDLVDGPGTIGLVPEAYRAERLKIIEKCGRFSSMIGVSYVITHVGFIPEDEYLPSYSGTVETLKQAAHILDRYECYFLMETGQETPVTLLRTLEDMNCHNAGVNLDTGNLIMYGRGDSAGAVDVLGDYIHSVHAKDGLYPTAGRIIGEETCCGDGRVRFAEVIDKLRKIGYDKEIMIEREISGEQKFLDIAKARALLLSMI